MKIDPQPVARIHPRVYSMMKAFTRTVFKDKHHDMEKGVILLGTVEGEGRVVNILDFAIFPQRGSRSGVEFDNKHPKAARFWPAVKAYCDKNNLMVVGWAHYFSGGVHHSHTDDTTDELLSQFTKGTKCPVMLSMTWNDVRAGVEGKFWVKWGDSQVQVSLKDVPIEYVATGRTEQEVLDGFLNTHAEKATIEVIVEFAPGIRYMLELQDFGLDRKVMLDCAHKDMRENLDAYLKAKDVGPKLSEALLNAEVNEKTVADVKAQLEDFWTPMYQQVGGTTYWDQLQENAKGLGSLFPTSTTPKGGVDNGRMSRRERAKSRTGQGSTTTFVDGPEDFDSVAWTILEDDVEDYIEQGLTIRELGLVLVVKDRDEEAALDWSIGKDRWTEYTFNLWNRARDRAEELLSEDAVANQQAKYQLQKCF